MENFLEVQINCINHLINLDHIASIKQVGLHITEITLLKPFDELGNCKFTFNFPQYGTLLYYFNENKKLITKLPIVAEVVKILPES